MSLLVSPYKRQANGDLEWIDVQESGEELAGWESTRVSFWGSDKARNLGLRLVPVLFQFDLFVEGPELDELEREITVLAENLDSFTAPEGYWEYRLGNVKRAIALARAVPDGKGGVYIG